jgi:hypothetical protein
MQDLDAGAGRTREGRRGEVDGQKILKLYWNPVTGGVGRPITASAPTRCSWSWPSSAPSTLCLQGRGQEKGLLLLLLFKERRKLQVR